jgi:16S rRNA processing protein RimM
LSDYYLIAEINSAYGNDGTVSIISHSDKQERFFNLKNVFIEVFGLKKEFLIEKVLNKKGQILIKFKNFNNKNEVDFLIGKKIFVDEGNLVKLEDNEYFIHDLIGSRVFRNNTFFGEVIDVLLLPANDILVIRNLAGEEELIPVIHDYIDYFDVQKKELTLKPGGDIYEKNED